MPKIFHNILHNISFIAHPWHSRNSISIVDLSHVLCMLLGFHACWQTCTWYRFARLLVADGWLLSELWGYYILANLYTGLPITTIIAGEWLNSLIFYDNNICICTAANVWMIMLRLIIYDYVHTVNCSDQSQYKIREHDRKCLPALTEVPYGAKFWWQINKVYLYNVILYSWQQQYITVYIVQMIRKPYLDFLSILHTIKHYHMYLMT